jgi:hypothetical protein
MESGITVREGLTIDPQRLKFVTENLASLQGLNTVAMGAGFFLFSVRDIWKIPWWAELLSETLQLLLFVVVARGVVTKYYERRFGRVEPKAKSLTTRREAIGCLIFILLFAAALIWGRQLEAWVDTILIGDPSGQTRLVALLLWFMWLSKSLRKDSRIDPRGPFFYFVGLVVSVAVAFYPKWHPGVTQFLLWRTLNVGSLWLTLTALGLRDHFVLVRALPKNGSDDEDDS